MSFIKIEHLKKEYPGVTPLRDVCAEIERGEVIAVIGPSGTGKSTLLRCLNRLEEPTSGTVTLDGEVITDPGCDITKVRRRMGMVFQSFNLFNNLTVLENVATPPMKLLKVPRAQAEREALALLDQVGVLAKADVFPEALSGGQKQRVAIARAIAMKPEALLFDEPTSALDPTMVGEVLAVIRALAREGMTMLIVTHEMKFAREIASRVFYMDEGGIYEEGTPTQVFDHPRREKTRQFIRRLKTLELTLSPGGLEWPDVLAALQRFAREAMLDRVALRNLSLTLEELLTQLMPRGPVRARVEHSDADDTTAVTLAWPGERFDPFTQGDPISAGIVKKLAARAEYRCERENLVEVLL